MLQNLLQIEEREMIITRGIIIWISGRVPPTPQLVAAFGLRQAEIKLRSPIIIACL